MLFEDYLNDCLYDGGKSMKVISGLTWFSKSDHYRLVIN